MDPYFSSLTPELRRMYLKQRQSLPLSVKIELSKRRIREWYDAHEGRVYVSFSGGKDSTVVGDLVRSMYPEVPFVFVDTGLEYPEIREFVRSIENVVWLKPKKSFKEVLAQYGYPVIGKKQAESIYKLRNHNLTDAYRAKLMQGDEKGNAGKVAAKWQKLITAPFKVSDKCCYHIKKQPIDAYAKTTGQFPITGEMAEDSRQRELDFITNGCNAFNTKHPRSKPLAFWTEADIWAYLKMLEVPYCKIYDMGERRTGCVFCAFGVHTEKSPNRFERLRVTHPQLHAYCMEKLGMAEVLDFIDVPY